MLKIIKEFKFILSLIVIIVVLALIARWDNIKTDQEEKIAAQKVKVFNISSKDVVEINYSTPKEDISTFKLSLLPDKSIWYISGGKVKEVADQAMVSNFLQTLEELDFKTDLGVVDDNEKLSAFGLKDSAVSLSISLKDAEDIRVSVGSSPPVGGGVYLKVNDKVYLCEEFAKMGLTKNFISFRDKKVIKLDPSRISKISFVYPESSVIVEKADSGYVIKNSSVKVDDSKVTGFIDSLNSTLVSSFIDQPGSDISRILKTKHFLDLFLQDQDKKELKLEFAFQNDKVYYKYKGKTTVYESSAELKNILTKTEHSFEPDPPATDKKDTQDSSDGDLDIHSHSHSHSH